MNTLGCRPCLTGSLTTGVDTFTGGVGVDTFTASVDTTAGTTSNTLSAADKINGGAGLDTLNLTVVAAGPVANATNGADISNIETINVRALNTGLTTLNAATTPGVTTVVSDRSTGELTVTNLAAGATAGLKGNGVVSVGTLTAGYVDGATAANITVSGGNILGAGTISVNGIGLTSATITSTGTANAVAGVAFTGAVKAVTVDAQSNVNTGNITSLVAASTITVKGDGTANIGTLQAGNVTVLDASANLGGVTAVLNDVATLVATGGAGNDVFTTGAVLATGANVNAGAGTADRLVISDSTHLTAAAGALYKGFEQVQVADGVSADVSLLAANNTINTVIIADGVGNTGVSGLTAAQAANVQITSTGGGASGITIGVAGASTAGQIDTVKAALTTSDTAGVVQNIDLTGLALAGVEKLELTANGTTAANSGTVTLNTAAASSLDSIILKSAGLNSITVTSAGSNLSVDASGSTGNTTINAGGYVSTTGASLKGGAGHDVLTGSAQSDNIVAGAGNDVLATSGVATVIAGSATATAAATITNIAATLTASADVLTGGAGNDSFVIAHSEVANVSSITDLNLGTNVVAGAVDSLWFNGATGTAATIVTLTAAQQTAVTGAGSLAAAVDLVLTTASGVNNVAQFTYGTDTYIVANGDANATYDVAADNLIKITGVTGVLDASDIHFVAA